MRHNHAQTSKTLHAFISRLLQSGHTVEEIEAERKRSWEQLKTLSRQVLTRLKT